MITAADSSGTRLRRRRGRWLLLGILLAGALLAAGAAWRHWGRPPAPPPPAVALDGLDPRVARAFASARDDVLAAPRSGRAWGNYGMVLAANGYRAEAMRCFAEAERLEPDEARWPYYTGYSLLQSDLPAGIGKLRQALALCQDDPQPIRLQLAQALFTHGEWDEAEQTFRQILAANPRDPLGHLGLARLAWERDRDAECLAELRHCLSNPCTRKTAHQLLAELHQRRGENEDAAREARAAAALPEDLGRPDEYLDELDARQAGFLALVAGALKLRDRGQTDRARLLLEQAVREYPDRGYAWLEYARVLSRSGDPGAAEAALRRAIDVTPDLVEAHFELGALRYARKDYPAAVAAFRRAAEIRPSYAWAHYNLGQALEAEGKRAEAAEAYRAALRCQPNFAEPRQALEKLPAADRPAVPMPRQPGGPAPEGPPQKVLPPERR